MPVKTGTLQGSIAFTPAKRDKSSVNAAWGSFDVNYAFYQEVSRGRRFLRDAAAQEYPKLGDRIANHFQ